MLACRAVLFDLDGTLVDAVPDLADATRAMLVELGEAPRSDEEVGRFIGKGLGVLVERALTLGRAPADAARIDHALAVFKRHYAHSNGRRAVAYPHARDTLQTLHARGFRLGCVTNKAAEFTEPLLRQLGLAEFLDSIVSGDTLPQKKPQPEPLWHACAQLGVAPDDAVMVGDSVNDAQAAHAAGIRLVLVTYGYSEGQPVDSIPCDKLVSGLAELPGLFGPEPRLKRESIL
ncbi:phosphoglycolate phosphatase [Uliginosibacterium sp. H1]|uniref:phosphoglycolate phosphatase n=1 Tax=Uliginosibacterium sp. H1 TaxID=3114757 RepID=UPI002E18B75A|nr:phosphoglycolate phosphatase [Uliginosibacterium sp. H1]